MIQLARLRAPSSATVRAIAFLGAYLGWMAIFRLLALSVITYLVTSSGNVTEGGARFEEVNEAFASAEIIALGIGAGAFVALLRLLHPLVETQPGELFSWKRLETRFAPGACQGAILAGGLVAAYLAAGNYRYLGFILQVEESPLALIGLVLKCLALASLVFSEEYIFRHRALRPLARDLGDGPAIALVAFAYVLGKEIQFGVGWMQAVSLFLVSLSLGLRARKEGDFLGGAGLWAAALLVIHPLLSLPVFGNDSGGGLFLIKYQAARAGHLREAIRLVSGGAGGPIASLGFQLLMIFDILREYPWPSRDRKRPAF